MATPSRPPTEPSPEARVRWKRARGLAVALVSFVLALALVEGVHRSRSDFDTDTSRLAFERHARADPVISSIGEERARPTGRDPRVLHPYVGFTHESWRERLDNRLARSPRATDFEIVIVGGSVASIFGRRGTRQLTQRLQDFAQRASKRVRFLNMAVAAHKQPQQLLVLSYLLSLGVEPDVVLNLDGYNELALTTNNLERSIHPILPSSTQWLPVAAGGLPDEDVLDRMVSVRLLRRENRREAELALRTGLFRSSLVAELWLPRLADRETQAVELQEQYADRLGQERSPTELGGPRLVELSDSVAYAVASWERASRAMHALCTAKDIVYLHVLQPTLNDAGSKPLTDEERAHAARAHESVRAAVRTGYPRMRSVGQRLRDEGVTFIDASGVFHETATTLYQDTCHFDDLGSELVADAIAGVLLECLESE